MKEKGHSFPKLGMLDLVEYLDVKKMKCLVLNPFRPNPGQKEKINLIFISIHISAMQGSLRVEMLMKKDGF